MSLETVRKSPSGPVIGKIPVLGGAGSAGGAHHALTLADYSLVNLSLSSQGTLVVQGGLVGEFENTTGAAIDLTFDTKIGGQSIYNAPMVQTVPANSKAIVTIPVAGTAVDTFDLNITVSAGALGVDAVVWDLHFVQLLF